MKPRIFVAPMNWGLGHATRCIPLINSLLENDVEVVLGGEDDSLQLLTEHFPNLSAVELPAYNIRYSKGNNQVIPLLKQVPYLLKTFEKEHNYLQKLIPQLRLNAVISDNRYGLHSASVPSVFMAHQIAPMAPFHWLVYKLHCQYIKCFDTRWIPDFPTNSPYQLAGDLAHKFPLPPETYFIGALSRFENTISDFSVSSKIRLLEIEIVVLLSGPEPHRTLFANLIKQQASLISPKKILLIEGKMHENQFLQHNNLTIVSHLHQADLQYILQKAEVIISRSGYSSLMDFATLGLKNIVFVPTPGQTEQIHLAQTFEAQNIAPYYSQTHFSIDKAVGSTHKYIGFIKPLSALSLRQQAITNLLAKIVAN